MASFTGTNANETITPALVSPGVTTVGGTLPSDLADVIDGSGGDDTIDAAGGADTVRGGAGNDTVQLGAGDDTALWDFGDGIDTIDGGADFDTLVLAGSGGADDIAVSSPSAGVATVAFGGSLVATTRAVEQISLRPLGGADNIAIGDLSGTAVTTVAVNLADVSALPDGFVDNLTIDGGGGDDTIALSLSGALLQVNDGAGPMPQVLISGFDAFDTVHVRAGGGADSARLALRSSSRAALVAMSSSAAGAAIGSSAVTATIPRSWVPATTPSCGAPATTMTSSRGRTE
jgi:Ca2+-binding RTX toxin-like protein